MDTCSKLKKLRLEKKYSLQKMAELVGVNKTTVKRWEDGDIANMGIDKLRTIAHALGVTPYYLLGWEDEEGNLTYKAPKKSEREEKIDNVLQLVSQLSSENLDLAAALLQTMIGKQE